MLCCGWFHAFTYPVRALAPLHTISGEPGNWKPCPTQALIPMRIALSNVEYLSRPSPYRRARVLPHFYRRSIHGVRRWYTQYCTTCLEYCTIGVSFYIDSSSYPRETGSRTVSLIVDRMNSIETVVSSRGARRNTTRRLFLLLSLDVRLAVTGSLLPS